MSATMESEIISFEDYVKRRKDANSRIIDRMVDVDNIKDFIDCLPEFANKTTIVYNEEDHKCYCIFNNKLYKLSVTLEEVEV